MRKDKRNCPKEDKSNLLKHPYYSHSMVPMGIIYVRGTDELVFGRSYWPTKNNGLMKSATYQFDENGIMQNPPV